MPLRTFARILTVLLISTSASAETEIRFEIEPAEFGRSPAVPKIPPAIVETLPRALKMDNGTWIPSPTNLWVEALHHHMVNDYVRACQSQLDGVKQTSAARLWYIEKEIKAREDRAFVKGIKSAPEQYDWTDLFIAGGVGAALGSSATVVTLLFLGLISI